MTLEPQVPSPYNQSILIWKTMPGGNPMQQSFTVSLSFLR